MLNFLKYQNLLFLNSEISSPVQNLDNQMFSENDSSKDGELEYFGPQLYQIIEQTDGESPCFQSHKISIQKSDKAITDKKLQKKITREENLSKFSIFLNNETFQNNNIPQDLDLNQLKISSELISEKISNTDNLISSQSMWSRSRKVSENQVEDSVDSLQSEMLWVSDLKSQNTIQTIKRSSTQIRKNKDKLRFKKIVSKNSNNENLSVFSEIRDKCKSSVISIHDWNNHYQNQDVSLTESQKPPKKLYHHIRLKALNLLSETDLTKLDMINRKEAANRIKKNKKKQEREQQQGFNFGSMFRSFINQKNRRHNAFMRIKFPHETVVKSIFRKEFELLNVKENLLDLTMVSKFSSEIEQSQILDLDMIAE